MRGPRRIYKSRLSSLSLTTRSCELRRAAISFGRKKLCDLIDAACRSTVIDPRSVEHALADSPPRRLRRTARRRNVASRRGQDKPGQQQGGGGQQKPGQQQQEPGGGQRQGGQEQNR